MDDLIVQSKEAILATIEEWDNYSLVERREFVANFETRVREMEVHTPYDTDPGITHHLGFKTYGREAFVPAGVAMVGMKYKHEQVNILLQGKVFVATEDMVSIMEAPCVFVSKPGTNKVGYVLEDMRWITVVSRDNENTDPASIISEHEDKGGG